MRVATLLTAVLVVCLLLSVCGCGKRARQAAETARAVQDARDGDFTVKGEKGEQVQVKSDADKESGTVTVTSDKGTTVSEYGKDKVSEAEVGVAFYPGAEVENAVKSASSGGDKQHFATVALVTTDPFAQVASFYKDKYAAGNTIMEQPDNLMVMMKEGENAGKMIMVTTEEGKTKIVITQAGSQ